jgi:microcystin-dependent protein
MAQAPDKISYQAVVRDGSNQLVTNTYVGLRISILQGSESGTTVYEETQVPKTNANGLVSVKIGEGNTSDDLSTVQWEAGPYFIKTETDLEGGTDYTITGISQLLSVPYAMHANTADSLTGPLYEIDGSITNEIQILSISHDTVFLSDGGFVKIPYGPDDAAEDDLISFDGSNWVAKSALIQNTGGGMAQNNMQPWTGIYHIIALQGVFPSRTGIDPFLAEIIMFAGNFAPRGWAFCDGQLLSIASNTALFSLLGTTFGGDGRTTFGLPDLRGRTAVHPGTGPGLSNRSWGEKGGTETNTMTINQMPVHHHVITYQ